MWIVNLHSFCTHSPILLTPVILVDVKQDVNRKKEGLSWLNASGVTLPMSSVESSCMLCKVKNLMEREMWELAAGGENSRFELRCAWLQSLWFYHFFKNRTGM